MAVHDKLVPGNSMWRTILIESPSATTGELEAVTTGTVTAFLVAAEDDDDTADLSAVDPSLVGTVAHVGVADPGEGEFPLGTWLITFLGSILTLAILETSFPTPTGLTKPYLVIQRAGSLRVIERLHYKRARKAILA